MELFRIVFVAFSVTYLSADIVPAAASRALNFYQQFTPAGVIVDALQSVEVE